MVSTKRNSKAATAGDESAVLLSPDFLEPRHPVSPSNIAHCQHCGANHTQLRRISCWEWYVPQKKYWEAGYIAGCLSCLKETRREWTPGTQHHPSWKDGD